MSSQQPRQADAAEKRKEPVGMQLSLSFNYFPVILNEMKDPRAKRSTAQLSPNGMFMDTFDAGMSKGPLAGVKALRTARNGFLCAGILHFVQDAGRGGGWREVPHADWSLALLGMTVRSILRPWGRAEIGIVPQSGLSPIPFTFRPDLSVDHAHRSLTTNKEYRPS